MKNGRCLTNPFCRCLIPIAGSLFFVKPWSLAPTKPQRHKATTPQRHKAASHLRTIHTHKLQRHPRDLIPQVFSLETYRDTYHENMRLVNVNAIEPLTLSAPLF